MSKLHIGLLFGQHPVLRFKPIAQFHGQIRNPYYLPHQIVFGLYLNGIDFNRNNASSLCAMHPNHIFGSDSGSGTIPKLTKPHSLHIEHPSDWSAMRLIFDSFGTHSTTHPSKGQPQTSRRKHWHDSTQRLADNGTQIIGTEHDEIILAVPHRLAGEAAVILRETRIQAGKAQ